MLYPFSSYKPASDHSFWGQHLYNSTKHSKFACMSRGRHALFVTKRFIHREAFRNNSRNTEAKGGYYPINSERGLIIRNFEILTCNGWTRCSSSLELRSQSVLLNSLSLSLKICHIKSLCRLEICRFELAKCVYVKVCSFYDITN